MANYMSVEAIKKTLIEEPVNNIPKPTLRTAINPSSKPKINTKINKEKIKQKATLLEMIKKYEFLECQIKIQKTINDYNSIFINYKLASKFYNITNDHINNALRQIRQYLIQEFSSKDVLLLTDKLSELKRTLMLLEEQLVQMDGLKTMELIIKSQYRSFLLNR